MTHRRPMDSQGFVYMALHHNDQKTIPTPRTSANRVSAISRRASAALPYDNWARTKRRSTNAGGSLAAGKGSVRSPMDSRGFVHQALCHQHDDSEQRLLLDPKETNTTEKALGARRKPDIHAQDSRELRNLIEGISKRIDDSPPQAKKSYATRNSSVGFKADSSRWNPKDIRTLPHQQSSIGRPIYSDPPEDTSLPITKAYLTHFCSKQARASMSENLPKHSLTCDQATPIIRSREQHYSRVLKGSLSISGMVPTMTEKEGVGKRVTRGALREKLKTKAERTNITQRHAVNPDMKNCAKPAKRLFPHRNRASDHWYAWSGTKEGTVFKPPKRVAVDPAREA